MEADELLSTFNHLQEYKRLLNIVLDGSVDDVRAKDSAVYQIGLILEIYQEQSYLLDPYLDEMLSPAINALSASISNQQSDATKNTLSKLVYTFTKTRGYKVISRFFPHSIPDLVLVMDAAQSFSDAIAWEFRYVVLLWLSIAIKLPFELAKIFPDRDVADELQRLCTTYFFHPGKEREGAVLAISRAFMRQDMRPSLHTFVEWCSQQLESKRDNAFVAPSILQFFCEILKVSQDTTAAELQATIETALQQTVDTTSTNPLLRKYHVKLTARLTSKLSADIDKVEETVGSLLEYLSDSDTIVRWSAAKHLSRLAKKLDDEGRRDILEALLSLYADGTNVEDATSDDFAQCDYSQVSENTWHGVTLALAECTRNGVVPNTFIPQLIPATLASLHFDLKKGAASVGSNTRDAAAYFFWSAARTIKAEHLSTVVDRVSINLIQKALFDREVHIRRAASAAFQELVGRTNLVKDGIDVLRAVDFFVVGVRRTAFLEAAVEVCEYPFYRDSIIPFVVKNVTTHWDFDVRKLASQFLGSVCKKHPQLVSEVVEALLPRIATTDPILLHGSLATLHQLASAFPSDKALHDRISTQLHKIQLWVFQTPRFSPVLEVCNNAIAAVSNTESASGHKEVSLKIINAGLTHKSEVVRYAAANALGALSRSVDCSGEVKTMMKEFDAAEDVHQQAIALALGYVRYTDSETHTQALECLTRITTTKSLVIECRVNAYDSLAKLCLSAVSADERKDILHTLYDGLWDYTVDQRGDVGAWVRQSCARGLSMCICAHHSQIDTAFIEMATSRLVGISLDNIYTSRCIAIEELGRMVEFTTSALATPLGDFISQTRQLTQDVYSSDKIYECVVPLYSACGEVRDGILMGLALAIISKNEVSVYSARRTVISIAEMLQNDVLSRTLTLADVHTKTSFFTGLANLVYVVADECSLHASHLPQLLAFNHKYCQKSKVITRITVGLKLVAVLYFKYEFAGAGDAVRTYLAHPLPRIRGTAAEEIYIQAQSSSNEHTKLLDWLMDTDWLGKAVKMTEVPL